MTNHHASNDFAERNVDLEELDTCERLEALEDGLAWAAVSTESALKALLHASVLSDDTQHQVVMYPRSGRMIVRVPGGAALDLTP